MYFIAGNDWLKSWSIIMDCIDVFGTLHTAAKLHSILNALFMMRRISAITCCLGCLSNYET